jgi:hypothetical protein
MTPLFVCTQIFNRYDCIRRLVESCHVSTRRPDGIFIVDHGYDSRRLLRAVSGATDIPVTIITLEDPGCSHNGNWFLRNIPDDRIGCGDDVEFTPTALELLAATPGDLVIPRQTLNPAACCIIRNSCVEKVGFFDEQISPGYLYFDDTDYFRRLDLAGVPVTVCEAAEVIHMDGGSQSHRSMTPMQTAEHHRRFPIAEANYIWKWGGPPFKETLTEPRPWPRPEGWSA